MARNLGRQRELDRGGERPAPGRGGTARIHTRRRSAVTRPPDGSESARQRPRPPRVRGKLARGLGRHAASGDRRPDRPRSRHRSPFPRRRGHSARHAESNSSNGAAQSPCRPPCGSSSPPRSPKSPRSASRNSASMSSLISSRLRPAREPRRQFPRRGAHHRLGDGRTLKVPSGALFRRGRNGLRSSWPTAAPNSPRQSRPHQRHRNPGARRLEGRRRSDPLSRRPHPRGLRVKPVSLVP